MPLNLNSKTGEHQFRQATPLQVARGTGNRVHGTSSGTSQRFTLPSGATLLEIRAAEAVYLNFGGAAVDAAADVTSQYFPAGVQVVPVPDNSGSPATHLAYIQATTAGVVQAEEVE